jgi:(+)-pinoresinol hydroxylase
MKLPEGVSKGDFERALHEFSAVVGAEGVFSKPEDVALYDDAYTPFVDEPDKQFVASAAVAPTSVEQVQSIVRIANQYTIPLYAISTGRNLGYGGSSPTYSGSVIVDLKRMNRVVEVNEREAYMIVEPGVSFMDLQKYFDEHQHPFLVATPDPGWGSPIGNALDHGISGVAGDNFGMVQGLEVVLPSGELLRTGCGGVPTSKLWANYHYGFGPYVNGMFSQSNFGIVTKMVFGLVRIPQAEQSFTVTSYKHADMEPLLDAIQRLRYDGILHASGFGSPIRESMSVNDGREPYGVADVLGLHRRRDGGTFEQWEKLASDHQIPVVRVGGAVRGPMSLVRATIEHAREVFGRFPGVTFKEGRTIDFAQGNPMRPAIQFGGFGVEMRTMKHTSRGHYYFSPMFKPTVEDVFALNDTIRNVMLDTNDLDMLDNYGWSAGWNFAYPKAGMILMELLVTDDVALNRKRRDLYVRLTDACGSKGWPEYRAPVAFQDHVMDQYSFDDHVLRRFNETIKDSIDPNGILAPGKSGIWPRRLRKAREA